MKKATLVLEDNAVFSGVGFGTLGTYSGELVFNTAMTGYMESLTDPSYAGQILTFAYPLIGNYGATFAWGESKKIHPAGIVVSELCDHPFHKDSTQTLEQVFESQGLGGISGIDTRMLIKKIRTKGTAPAVLFLYEDREGSRPGQLELKTINIVNPKGVATVVLLDYGAKGGIVQELADRNLRVVILPSNATAKDVLKYHPAGIVLSNGPGDPKDYPVARQTIADLLKLAIPIFGICLGHQLLALAAGANTYKLKFGHRGINQPVAHAKTKRAFLTSQNHGYAVDAASLPPSWEVTYLNLNDLTVEGLRHSKQPFFSVQFHPEANPGPFDSRFLFDEFVALMRPGPVSSEVNNQAPAEARVGARASSSIHKS